MIDLFPLLDEVPDYKAFLTLDEMFASSRQLAADYPDVVSLVTLGHSRKGHPIEALKIGTGSKTGMMVGLPHPNEPIGAMMIEFFSRKLAEDAALRESLDYTWYLIKSVDPDGTVLNEGWYKGPFTITHYARNFYRPPSAQQVEWTFPIDYKTYSFHDALPETQAWMKLIEEVKPDFIYSLHNAGFGGVYLYISHNFSALYPPFYELVEKTELPLHLGEPEVPYAVTFSKAVYQMLGLSSAYDFMAQNMEGDPAKVLSGGASSYDYARRFGDPIFLICEMPYFYSEAINNLTLTDQIRRDSFVAGIEVLRAKWNFMGDMLNRLGDALTVQSPFRDAVSQFYEMVMPLFDSQINYANSNPDMEKQATVAELFDNTYGKRFYTFLNIGQLVRALETEIAQAGETPAVKAALEEALAAFHAEAKDLETNIDYSSIPIKKLVQVQLGTALLTLAQQRP